MKLYLVRHGETDNNASNTHQDSEEKLSDKGQRQAVALGQRFKTIPIELLIASPYVRTQQTAQEIIKTTGVTMEKNDLIVEFRWPSQFNGKKRTDPEITAIRKQIENSWEMDPSWKHSDEESFAELRKRAADFLAYAKTLNKEHVAVVSHARFLKILIAVLIHGPEVRGKTAIDMIYSIALNNTGITVVEPHNEKWEIITINDHAHLGEYQNHLSQIR